LIYFLSAPGRPGPGLMVGDLPLQTRQRSLLHHWQEKQSGQGFFFLQAVHSGT